MSWTFRYHFNGKQEKVTLGSYPDLTLKRAREQRDTLATQIVNGISPAEEKRKKQTEESESPIVKDFGERYYKEQIVKCWKDPISIRRYLEKEIYPAMGNHLLNDITAVDVQAVVYRKRDGGHPSAAIQIRNVIKRMYDYAVEVHLATVNPAAMVATRYIGKARKRTRHLTSSEIREYLQVIYRSNIRRQFKLALHIILLTLVRKSMLIEARWKEVNFETEEWNIPAGHMKGDKEHVVYMSSQVMAMFRELKALSGGSELVLPGRGSLLKPFAKNALNKALEGLTFNMDHFTIHDSRRTASTELNENGFSKEWIEKALSHETGGIEGVYNRAEFAKQRKQMLQWWADYVDSIVTESKVIIGNFGRS